ncbi:hypothetical protein PV327_009559 [Microctonus hyperodae]|uniref:Uncharacterized protein n=1 Tax=Microctonus hyperodae TaxID=165561 RepID=A0AA39F180_MICHY|nr:hypothetical protein PV327_009559 [Microctonus hyperodae]
MSLNLPPVNKNYRHRVKSIKNYANVQIGKIYEYTAPLIPATTRISTINPIRVKEIDDFFIGVQLHRQQYKDRTGLLHPIEYFTKNNNNTNQLTASYFCDYETTFIKYKIPIVLPTTYERSNRLPSLPERPIYGVYKSK